MFEQLPTTIREKVNFLATESLKRSNPSWWFEVLYNEAKNDPNQIPWAKMQPHPYFQDWLDKKMPSGNHHSALVVGCGLGDDAEALAKFGFKVTAFDISSTAINWCKKRFPDSVVKYVVADLFNLDSSWHNQFDFVYECRNIQALPLEVRSEVIESIAKLVAINGNLLVINRLRDTEEKPEGPPWPLSLPEFHLFQQFGLTPINSATFGEGENNQVTTLRIEYRK